MIPPRREISGETTRGKKETAVGYLRVAVEATEEDAL